MKTVKWSNRFTIILIFSLFLLFFSFWLNISIGKKCFTPYEVFNLLFKSKNSSSLNILLYSRIPRALASIFAGGALAVSGCILQNVLLNPLAAPSIIGVNSGAGFGFTIAYALGIFSGWELSLFSFLGAIFSLYLIILFSKNVFSFKNSVILGGVALNSILNALSEVFAVLSPDVALLSAEFRVGGFSAVTYPKLLPPLIIILSSILILFFLFNRLDVLSLGDETASSVGLNIKKYRVIFLIIASLLAGAAVSFSGLLGFIGLIIPHCVRKIVGNESKKLIPLSLFLGAAFVCFCDFISRTVFFPYEIPVGIIMSIIGGPVFIVILIKSKKENGYA